MVNFTEIKGLYQKGRSVVSNYLHMTILQVANSFFYLLIYPFVINAVGTESFGLFVFASSIAAYFMVFVNFGFDIHCAKLVPLHPEDGSYHASLLSTVTLAKLGFEIVSLLVFSLLVLMIPFMSEHRELFWLCFCNTLSSVFLPMWYFHGRQKMKVLTIVQLAFKLLSLPVVFVMINDASDIDAYASIVVGANVLSSMVAFLIMIRLTGATMRWPGARALRAIVVEVQPFFWSTATNTLKQRSVEIIIGSLFGMKEVAIYDLANKIFSVPSLLVSNINAALFPMMVKVAKRDLVGKIIKIELFMALLCILSVALFGSWVVELVSAPGMGGAYYIAMLLSLNIVTFLVVGSHIYFIFVPQQRYDYVLRNQVVSVISFYLFCGLYLAMSWSIYSVVLALVTSALLEIVYSYSLVKKMEGY